jgi:hypothetical protein
MQACGVAMATRNGKNSADPGANGCTLPYIKGRQHHRNTLALPVRNIVGGGKTGGGNEPAGTSGSSPRMTYPRPTREQLLAAELELNRNLEAYVKNDHLGFAIPYINKGRTHSYVPDFLVRLKRVDGEEFDRTLIIEVSGSQKSPGPTQAKATTARDSWCAAVNNHGGLGRWGYIEMTDPLAFKMRLAQGIQALYSDQRIPEGCGVLRRNRICSAVLTERDLFRQCSTSGLPGETRLLGLKSSGPPRGCRAALTGRGWFCARSLTCDGQHRMSGPWRPIGISGCGPAPLKDR